jgi:hypothetical protein
MESPLDQVIEAEIARLERELDRARAALSAYKGEKPPASGATTTPLEPTPVAPLDAPPVRRRRRRGVRLIRPNGSNGAMTKVSEAANGYKMVPLPKADRIKMGAAEFLKRQPHHRAHRSEVAQYLLDIGVLGDIKNPISALSVYFAKWPDEFKPDGNGNLILLNADENGAAHE